MKFGSVLFSEDSSARLSNVWPNINSPREEGLDTQHGDNIQQNQLHVNVLGNHHISIQPDWKKKKTLFTLAPLNHMHKGHCSYFAILKIAAVSSTIILPLSPN